MLGAHKE